MSAESNVEFVKDLFGAFGRGDIGYVIDAHAEDVVSESPVSRTSTLPWAGFFLFAGTVWARIVGVTVAVLWALFAFAWMPWYPVWAIMLIAISVSVIWALTAHGHDIVEG
jgi:hypothetical protein